jgi:hypothetical protein
MPLFLRNRHSGAYFYIAFPGHPLAAIRETKGGHNTFSTLDLLQRRLHGLDEVDASSIVVFIFQLPAIIGIRDIILNS